MSLQICLKSSEVKLVEALGAVRDPAGWQAVHFHLSDLMEQYKSEYQVKIAINLIYDLLKTYEGCVYLLLDHSIIVLVNRLDKTLLNKLIFQMRYLYMDDPLAYTEEGQENPGFCSIFDLASDWQRFMDASTRRMAMAVRKPHIVQRETQATKVETTTGDGRQHPVLSSQPKILDLSVTRLATIEQDMRRADLSRVLRRQPICTSVPGLPTRRVFDELYIHIAHLRQLLKSDVDFLSNRWLFKYLTHILDDRMLEMLRLQPARYLEQPVSLNLNVETLLSSRFSEFDAALKPSMKVSIIIEVPVVDVFADMAAFQVARKEVQKLGYRVCLDGLTAKSFSSIDREKLGLDLVKVQWNAGVQSDMNSPENQEFAQSVQRCGTNRIILCRCDNASAVEFGQALGISLFQGRHLDATLNPAAKVEN